MIFQGRSFLTFLFILLMDQTMGFFLKASALVVLFSNMCLAKTEENVAVNSTTETTPSMSADAPKETIPPTLIPTPNELNAVSLDDATKIVLHNTKNKLLAAKTEIEDGKKIHIIKILTPKGHIQYIRIEAATGKILEKAKK
jgi:uncharacterized membrane protein YkoI